MQSCPTNFSANAESNPPDSRAGIIRRTDIIPTFVGTSFVTICTKNRENFFGEICEREMSLSPIGEIVGKFWREIPAHFSNAKLDKFVVMPNHFHGILIIDNWRNGENHPTTVKMPSVKMPHWGVSTRKISTPPKKLNPHHNPEWKPGTIGVIINQFKSICTKHARRIRPDFAWQSRFHDHILRTEKNYNDAQNYILTNIANWEKDSENPQK